MKTIRFGVQMRVASDGPSWLDQIRRAESLNYDVVTMPDHFGGQFAPMPALAAAASVTTRIRLGTAVFCNDFKHPAVLAKELATLDVLSQGRLEIGLGAGWLDSDYAHTGIPLDAPNIRVERLEEAVHVIKRLLSSDDPLHFDGKHYQIRGLKGTPRPVQRPHPPIYIGGGGNRMLALAGREADIVGVHANLRRGTFDGETFKSMQVDDLEHKLERVRRAAHGRLEHVELALVALFVRVTNDAEQATRKIAEEFEVPFDVIRAMPNALIGTPQAIADQIKQQRERYGVTYYTISHESMEEFAEVISLTRTTG